MDRREAFLADLSALTRKHRIAVNGCGCCNSPFLTEDVPGDGLYRYDSHGWRELEYVTPAALDADIRRLEADRDYYVDDTTEVHDPDRVAELEKQIAERRQVKRRLEIDVCHQQAREVHDAL